jgi:hypothetical protein
MEMALTARAGGAQPPARRMRRRARVGAGSKDCPEAGRLAVPRSPFLEVTALSLHLSTLSLQRERYV